MAHVTAYRHLRAAGWRLNARRGGLLLQPRRSKCGANNAQLSPIPYLQRAALLNPNRTAIKYGDDTTLTYSELMVRGTGGSTRWLCEQHVYVGEMHTLGAAFGSAVLECLEVSLLECVCMSLSARCSAITDFFFDDMVSYDTYVCIILYDTSRIDGMTHT